MKEKTIGQIRLAMNHPAIVRLMSELKKRGNDVALGSFMEVVFWPAIEQAIDRENGNDKPIEFNVRRIKW